MEIESYIPLIGFFVASFAAASSGAFFRPGDWYEKLAKPSWRPPNWLFGPVWAILYGMIAVSGWLVWISAEGDRLVVPIAIFGVQLVLNFLWSAIFFGMHRLGLALIEMGVLWLAILANIFAFYLIRPSAAYLLVPYLLWVNFAFVLNFAVWRLNQHVSHHA
ncbi:MAG: TspO/MBR family protein [Kiloniellales bacterium]|nr:TspO/MBR family protein [Kiloniellales bacterium]